MHRVAGPAGRRVPDVPSADGTVHGPDGACRWIAVRGVEGFWLELGGGDDAALERGAQALVPPVTAVLQAEWQRARLARELAGRYEEIDLLYAITEILGRTVQLEEAAQTIVQALADVVGARRASIMVLDDDGRRLRTVGARGFTPDDAYVVDVDDARSVAARVFRERRLLASDVPVDGMDGSGDRQYVGHAFLAVPICYGPAGAPGRCIGVINLTDREGGDRFTAGDRKLLGAIAGQVGAAIENARLAARDRQQQRLHRELELAHDLQLKLLPTPAVLHGEARVAARCVPVDSVGGDFYTFAPLGRGRVGVMLGDVSSHGFSAALVMAHVLAAAGIHAAEAPGAQATLEALLRSVGDELRSTETFVTVFYGVLDRSAGTLSYASAGHAHAFRLPGVGAPERLGATCPPLGLLESGGVTQREVPWDGAGDLLCLWTDGLVESRNAEGTPFGETRLLARLGALRDRPLEAMVEAALAEVDAWAPAPADDRTLLLLRL
jgi:sigma-B regulation protein RsbU (phosphoserine phosphatase)